MSLKLIFQSPSPFIQRFNLDTEHHREGTEKHGEMILSVHLCEKLCVTRIQFHLKTNKRLSTMRYVQSIFHKEQVC